MLKKYKNKLFESLSTNSSTIDVNRFEYTEKEISKNVIVSQLTLAKSKMSYSIKNKYNSYDEFKYGFNQFAPGYEFAGYFPSEYSYKGFEDILDSIQGWINVHLIPFIEEENEIDLWNEYKNSGRLLSLEKIDFEDKSHFSFDERAQIVLALGDLKLLIERKFALVEKEMFVVNERLNYLVSAVDRLSKFDWKSIAISTMFSMAIALSLDVQKGHELFELFARVFNVIPQLLINGLSVP